MATKKKEAAVPVLKDITDVANAIRSIASAQVNLEFLTSQFNLNTQRSLEEHQAVASSYQSVIDTRAQAVQDWCEENRTALLPNETVSKTAEFSTGKVLWRFNPPSLAFTGEGKEREKEQKVIDLLKAINLPPNELALYVRTREEVNKETLLKAPEETLALLPVKIKQNEIFVILPYMTVEGVGGVSGMGPMPAPSELVLKQRKKKE